MSDSNNARIHDKKNLAAIKGSLTKFGQQKPIVISDKNIVLAGNGTLAAAIALGWNEIACVKTTLDEFNSKAYALADNRSSELASWDTDILGKTLKALSDDGFNIADIGFDFDQIFTEPEEGLTDEDSVPEQVDTRCKPGDLWILGNHRLLCGDSTNVQHVDRLMNGEKADMVFTDPPYGVSFVGIKGTMYKDGVRKGKDSSEQIKNDDLRGVDLTELFRDALALAVVNANPSAAFYIFFAINRSLETIPAVTDNGLEIRNWLIWDKGNVGFHAMGAQYKPNYESFLYCHLAGNSPIWQGTQQQQTIWRHSSERLGIHPTMKPVDLIAQAIANHNPKLVFDPFLGSGSTLIACEKTRRKCYGMEIDPHYCDVILKRWEDFTGKEAILGS